jgi:hypothetical protein
MSITIDPAIKVAASCLSDRRSFSPGESVSRRQLKKTTASQIAMKVMPMFLPD